MAELIHWYLHVDLDAFFASVEQLDNPQYRGKPVIVGGKPEDRRSVVSTASYEARKYGVHSAMPTYMAYKLCPQGIYVHGRMWRYAELSYQIMNIFRDFSPDVDQMSIDEAFIDITGTEKLFGPPEKTAMLIKQTVKEKTGLTVSVGLATTKYLAKIASGFQKPDGFTYIHKGDEQQFMLSLPLNKVWGLGPKSLELLKSKGINSTRDIYEKSFDTLEFLFGKNMASFLFDVIRGNEKESFSKETKNHSISAETTFQYDLSDSYTIETELLELAHGVFFRLLKHENYSRTAFIKIRYDDFTTFTAQETVDRNIITLDYFFDIIKRLFEKKYEKGRGVRLIGVGFENVEKEEKPYQQDLFGNNDQKKQAVEKAILNLEKKHPEIKVRKARTLKAILLFTLLLFSTKNKITAQTNQEGAASSLPDVLYVPENKDEKSIFKWDINDEEDVTIELEGFWQGDFSFSLCGLFGNDSFSFETGTPLFKQEVELSALVLIKDHWFLQGDFAEGFKKNTVTAGYKNGNLIKLAKLSNRNITMTPGYSSDFLGYSLSGGENQAPGFSMRMEAPEKTWAADFLIRYDMTETKSAVFYGMNHATDSKIAPENFLYGRMYKFPDGAQNFLLNIKDIYVESKQGNYKDSNGHRFKKLSAADYFFNTQTNQLYLNVNADARKNNDSVPVVLITFIQDSAALNIVTLSGSYSNPDSFLGKIQNEFSLSDGKKYNLENFSYSLTCSIENSTALIIQNSYGFSPFLIPNIYDAGLKSNCELSVINETTETRLKEYEVFQNDELFTSLNEDYFHDKHSYSQVINQDARESFYPFVKSFPEIYLNLYSQNNIKILKRNYSPVQKLNIGTKASAGTVQVYKNGILDTGAVFNSETGDITLSSAVEQTDKIIINWQEDSNDFTNGALSAGAGFTFNHSEKLKSDISLTAHWPLTFTKNYSTPENLQRGFVALAGGIEYKIKDFTLTDKTVLAVQKENASKALLVLSQENHLPQTHYLDYNNGFYTQSEPVITINNIKTKLTSDKNCTLSNIAGITDSGISGYCIPLSWDFENVNNAWAAVDIKLTSGDLLKRSHKLNIALKPVFISPLDLNDYDIYLQLGINASKDYYGEYSDSLPEYKINLTSNEQWQTIQIDLTDYDRSKLISSHDARLIVIPKNNSLTNPKGTIYIGPYEPVEQSIFYTSDSNINVHSTSYAYEKDNYSSVINWNIPSTTEISDITETNITTVSNFTASDFTNYGTIDFDFYINSDNPYSSPYTSEAPEFTLILDSDAKNNNSDGNIALKLTVSSFKNYYNSTFNYHRLSIDLDSNTVFIDNHELNKSSYTLYINKNFIPTRQKIIINTVSESTLYKTGTFHIGSLKYSDSKLFVNGKNYASVKYQKDNLSVNLSSTQNVNDFSSPQLFIQSNASAQYTLKKVNMNADVSLNQATLSNAGHSIKSNNKIFNILSFEETYRFSNMDKTLNKKDSLSLSFEQFNFPLKMDFSTTAASTTFNSKQDTKASVAYNYSKENFTAGFETYLKAGQNINYDYNNINLNNYDNYFAGWYDISALEFSTGYSNAISRNTEYSTKLSTGFKNPDFTPSLEYILSSAYKNSISSDFTDKEFLKLSLPFAFKNNTLIFNISRTGSGTSIQNLTSDQNYISDLRQLFSTQSERSWFYSSIPFYELFDKTQINKITADYSAKYETIYKRKLFNSYKDLYIPSQASFSVSRDIKSTALISDLYQIKTTVTNTSVNNFGNKSKDKIFEWFNQEELITSLTGIVKIPTDIKENTTYQLTAYVQLLLFITDYSTLSTAFDFSFETNKNWSTHMTLIYARPSNTSLTGDLINFFLKDSNKIAFEIKRKELVNIELKDFNNQLRQTYSYKHSVELKFLKNYSISTGIGGSFIYVQDNTNTLSLDLSVGAKISF